MPCRGIAITEGRGVAHGRRIPLLPVVDMLRGYFGIGEDDDSRLAREKIAGRLLLIDEAFRETLPVLFGFLGVEDPDHAAPQMGPRRASARCSGRSAGSSTRAPTRAGA